MAISERHYERFLRRHIDVIKEKIVEGDEMVERWQNGRRGELQKDLLTHKRKLVKCLAKQKSDESAE